MRVGFWGLVLVLGGAWGCFHNTKSFIGITVQGTVSDALYRTRVHGVEVCITEPDQGCTTTGLDGVFVFTEVPRNTRLFLKFSANNYFPNVAHYTTSNDDEVLTYLLTSDDLADLGANLAHVTRDPNKGIIIFGARTGRGSDASNVENVSMTLTPTTAEGPFYAVSDGFDSSRTATTSVGGGAFFNVEPGTYILKYTHDSATCVPYYGWAGSEPNTLEVRVLGGTSTYTNQVCN